MELCYIQWISLLLVALVKGVWCDCVYPGDVTGATVVASTFFQTYTSGAIVLYECEGGKASHVFRKCNPNSTWTAEHRSCSDNFVWEYGGLGGVLVASLNYIIAISFMSYSKKFKAKNEDSQEEEKPKSTTSNGEV